MAKGKAHTTGDKLYRTFLNMGMMAARARIDGFEGLGDAIEDASKSVRAVAEYAQEVEAEQDARTFGHAQGDPGPQPVAAGPAAMPRAEYPAGSVSRDIQQAQAEPDPFA